MRQQRESLAGWEEGQGVLEEQARPGQEGHVQTAQAAPSDSSGPLVCSEMRVCLSSGIGKSTFRGGRGGLRARAGGTDQSDRPASSSSSGLRGICETGSGSGADVTWMREDSVSLFPSLLIRNSPGTKGKRRKLRERTREGWGTGPRDPAGPGHLLGAEEPRVDFCTTHAVPRDIPSSGDLFIYFCVCLRL